MMNRDQRIITDLERFRVMSRDDIIDIYFSHLKNPITCANTVLKRLVRDKQITVSQQFSPYVYLPYNSTIKRNSTKIPHFLKIVDVYKQIRQYEKPKVFEVEPKYSKGLAEPDVLTEIKGIPFFIEIQRNLYSQNVVNKKIKRYEALKYSEGFMDKKFPAIIMVSDTKYELNSTDIKVIQMKSINEFMAIANKKEKKIISKPLGIKLKIG